jgi:hypothetical protein
MATETRVVNIRSLPLDPAKWPADHVYIGRTNRSRGTAGSKWCNPFVVSSDCTREQAIEAFEDWITTATHLFPAKFDLRELRGKTLVCWCAPLPCHGDVLARLVAALESTEDASQ